MFFQVITSCKLAIRRLSSSKKTTFINFLAILISISCILGTNITTTYLYTSIVFRDLDNSFTDINLGISISDDIYQPVFNNVSSLLDNYSFINKTIAKYHVKGTWTDRSNNLSHYFVVNKSTNLTSENLFQRYSPLDIIGLKNDCIEEIFDLLDLDTNNMQDITLKDNETIISHYLAQKMNITHNETIYLHYSNHNSSFQLENQSYFNESYPLIVKNIINIKSKSSTAKTLLDNPFFKNEKGILDELIILNSKTLLDLLNYTMGDYRPEFPNQIVLSISLNTNKIFAKYSIAQYSDVLESTRKEIISILRLYLPSGTTFFSDNLLLDELSFIENDIKQLQNTLLLISIPLILFILFNVFYFRFNLISYQVRDYGILICRGLQKRTIRRSFLIEGTIIGIIAALGSTLTILLLVFLLFNIIPTSLEFSEWISIYLSVFPSYMVNSLFLGASMGLIINYFAINKTIMKLNPIQAIIQSNSNLEEWQKEKKRSIKIIIIPLLIIISFIIILNIISLTGYVNPFNDIFKLINDLKVGLSLFIPISLILLLIVIVTGRRDIIANYIYYFSSFVNTNIREIIRANYLRRPKLFSNLALITALAFTMSITPIMLSQSAHDVSIRQIKKNIGSDIKITGTYEELKELSKADFHNISDFIQEVTQTVYIEGDVILYETTNEIGYFGVGILAINPETFLTTMYFENSFTNDATPSEVFSQLILDDNVSLEPTIFKEEYNHIIGTITQVEIPIPSSNPEFPYQRTTFDFRCVGFVNLIPGLIQDGSSEGFPLLCSLDYISSIIPIDHQSQMTWFVKINPAANNTIRTDIFKSLNSQFKEYDVVFLDKSLELFRLTPTGSIVIILDSLFFVVLAFTIFSLSLTFFETFRERRNEIAIYRSRGMRLMDIRKMLISEMLSIDLLGATFGIILGFIITLTFKDILITPWPKIPVYMFFPWEKITFFILILIITHLISIFSQSYWYTRSKIVTDLRNRD